MNKYKNGSKIIFVLSVVTLTPTIGFSTWMIQKASNDTVINNFVEDIPVAYIIGKEDIKYTIIEKALDVAQSGDIVSVLPPTLSNYHPTDNNVLPDKVNYKISRNCEIKEGVTLIVPTDSISLNSVTDSSSFDALVKNMQEDDRTRGETTEHTYDSKASYGKYSTDNESLYLRTTITIEKNVQLTNKGKLLISGYLGGGVNAGAGIRGQTSHSYSQIVLEEGASIVQDSANATTYCYGYIKESIFNNNSFVNVLLGNFYLPLIVCDYKGFQFSSGIEAAVKEQACSPFNQFEMRNIESNIYFRYGSSVFGVSNIYVYQNAGFTTIEQTLHNSFSIVGSLSSFFIQLTDS